MALPSKLKQGECHCGQRSVWWMLLSHHAPCDLDRTWSFFGVHICVRCLAVILSIAVTLVFKSELVGVPLTLGRWLVLLLAIPAWVDFSLGELWNSYPRTNAFRLLTGSLFGWGAGCCLTIWKDMGDWVPLLCYFLMSLACELLVAFLFFSCGHLEHYLEKYEKAVGLMSHRCDCHNHE